MKGIVLGTPEPLIDEDKRTADLTVQYSEDDATPLEQGILVVQLDGLTQKIIEERLKDELQSKVTARDPIMTQATLNALAVGVRAIVPG
jgi:hypothetical protein